jgi:hypothetical protein
LGDFDHAAGEGFFAGFEEDSWDFLTSFIGCYISGTEYMNLVLVAIDEVALSRSWKRGVPSAEDEGRRHKNDYDCHDDQDNGCSQDGAPFSQASAGFSTPRQSFLFLTLTICNDSISED